MTNPERTKQKKVKKDEADFPTCQKCWEERSKWELIEGLCADCRQPICEKCRANHLTADCKQKKVEVVFSDEEELEGASDTDDVEIPTKEQTIQELQAKLTNLKNQLKTQAETLKKTEKELTQLQTQYQNHLTQEKTQLTKEIQLIKGVIHV